MSVEKHKHIEEALEILISLGMPRSQQNERSALSLLALLNLQPARSWAEAEAPLIGITPIMDWIRQHYEKRYAPNTRETIRRQTMHQFVQAGIVLYNPDCLDRPVNSPKAVYQIEPAVLRLLRSYGTPQWDRRLKAYLKKCKTLMDRYAAERVQNRIPIRIERGQRIALTPGKHSELIRDIVEIFGPRFVPGGSLIYVGDTGEKWGYFNENILADLGVRVDPHGKMPDVVFYDVEHHWLLLVEAVTSHGPMDTKRHAELAEIFAKSSAGLVYVTAFPTRALMAKHLGKIAWETEVWVAEAPSHLIHFDGLRFLGPYK